MVRWKIGVLLSSSVFISESFEYYTVISGQSDLSACLWHHRSLPWPSLLCVRLFMFHFYEYLWFCSLLILENIVVAIHIILYFSGPYFFFEKFSFCSTVFVPISILHYCDASACHIEILLRFIYFLL